jgi:hypothetical protein
MQSWQSGTVSQASHNVGDLRIVKIFRLGYLVKVAVSRLLMDAFQSVC